ncbi:hypothetical protein [uncultured Brevundimonas sp.]|uniref:hypothetical protein n=1 Tax=uncultured Brevundimonas sp. TaxID=213418 RepID=UPI003456F88C
MRVAVTVYRLTRRFPKHEEYRISGQMDGQRIAGRARDLPDSRFRTRARAAGRS